MNGRFHVSMAIGIRTEHAFAIIWLLRFEAKVEVA
jgi:hypothetical protein